MKTTIDIPDSLYRRAKIRAAERGVTMKTLLIESFERTLSEDTMPTIVEEPVAGYRASAKASPGRARPARAAKDGRRAKDDEYLGFTVNEFGIPVINRRPGDKTRITNELIDRIREEEGI